MATAGAAGAVLTPSVGVPPAQAARDSEKTFQFNASVLNPGTWPDGKPKQGGIWSINDQLPGPTIRAKEDDIITIKLCNNLLEPTTMHWHGMHQRGTWFMDGVEMISQARIPPGQCYTYRFKADPHGTHWYHSHTGVQYSDGLFGALIVEEKDNPYKDLYDYDRTVLFNDWFHQPSPQILANLKQGTYMQKGQKGPDIADVPFQSALINGKGRYSPDSKTPLEVFDVAKTDRIRFRLINASSTYAFKFAIDGHKLTVMAADGQLTKPHQVDSLVVAIGDRFDVIVNADQPVGNYWMRINTLEPGTNNGAHAILRYKGAPLEEPRVTAPVWGNMLRLLDLKPYQQTLVEKPSASSTLVLGGTMMPYQWTVDGKVFGTPETPIPDSPNPADPPTTQIKVNSGDVIRLILNDETGMNHPFHLHGTSFQVLGLSEPGAGTYDGGPLIETGAILKDTLDIPKKGWAVIQWKADNPGWWFFHCHIEWHLATGMAVVVKEGHPPAAPANVGQG
jgi:FtsP/CotA-like multicopper oxidase with cupredoxin domain